MGGKVEKGDVIDFLKTLSTATRYFEFMPEEQLAALPRETAGHIEELEDLLSRFSCEAEAMLWRTGRGHEIYPHLNKRSGQ